MKPDSQRMKRKEYEKQLERLHGELVKLQEWVKHDGLKVCVVFEGATAPARAARSRRSPTASARACSVVALPAPSDREKSQMYLQRHLRRTCRRRARS